MPYKDLTLAEVRDRIVKEPNFRLTLPPSCPPDIRDLVLRCWQSDVRTRATMDDLAKGLNRYSGQRRPPPPGAANNTLKTEPTQQSAPMQTASKPAPKSPYCKKRAPVLSQGNGSRKTAPAHRSNKASAPVHQRSNVKPAAQTPTKKKISPRPSAKPRPAQPNTKRREPVITRAPRTGQPQQTNQSRVNRSSKKSRKSTR